VRAGGGIRSVEKAALLDRFGLRLPERLKVPIPDPEM
jgi:hypothetical protein